LSNTTLIATEGIMLTCSFLPSPRVFSSDAHISWTGDS